MCVYVTFGTQQNSKILLYANITSNVHMRFIFKWFLDIFLNVCTTFYNQYTLRAYVKLRYSYVILLSTLTRLSL